MADNTIDIKVTANTEGFDNTIQSVAQSLRILREEAAGMSTQMSAASSVAKNNLTQSLSLVKVEAANVGSAMSAATVSLKESGAVAASGGAGVSFYTQELRALGDEAVSGRWRNFDGTLLNLAVHGAQSAASFAAMNPVVTGVGATIAAAGAALGYFALEAYEANRAMSEFKTATDLSGLRLTSDQMESIIAEMVKFSGNGKMMSSIWTSTATDIVSSYGAMRNGSEPVIRALTLATEDFAEMQRMKAPEAARMLAKAFDDPARSGQALVNKLTGLSDAQREQIQTAIQSGSIVAAQTAMMQGLSSAVESHVTRLRDEAGAAAATSARLEALNLGLTEGDAMERLIARSVNEATAAFDAQLNRVNALTAALGKIAPTARQIGDEVRSFNKEFDPTSTKISELTAKIAEMRKLQSGTTDQGMLGGLSSDIANASDQLKKAKADAAVNAQKQSDPLGIDRDLLHQDQDAIRSAENAIGQTREQRLQNAIAINRKDLEDTRLTTTQKKALEDELAAHERQLDDSRQRDGVKSAKDELGASEASIQGQIQHIEALTEHAIEQYDIDLAAKRITEDRKLALVTDALNKERAQIAALYQQEDALAGLSATKKTEIEDQAVAANDRVTKQILQAQKEAATQTEKVWDSSMKSINGAFDSQINGLITGTESWGTAARKTLADLTEQSIKYFVNLGLQQAESAAKQVVLNNSVTSSMAAAVGLQATSAAAAAKPGIMGQITADTGEAYAGFAAFLAPTMGPAALGAAAGLASSVQATAVGISAFDVGTDLVLSSGIAMIHAGEKIVPATSNGPYTGGSGGGTEVHFHINAIDVRGVADFLSSNGRQIASVVAGQQNNNPSLRGKW